MVKIQGLQLMKLSVLNLAMISYARLKQTETDKMWQKSWVIAHEIEKYSLHLIVYTGLKMDVNGQISWVIAHEIVKFDSAESFTVRRNHRSWEKIVSYSSWTHEFEQWVIITYEIAPG